MGIDVAKLKTDIPRIKKGKQQVEFSYWAVADKNSDNDVTLELFVEPDTPVYLIDDQGVSVKSVPWTDKFPLNNPEKLTKQFEVEVTMTAPQPESCSLRLEATSAKNNKSACKSHIIYYK